MKKVKEYPDPKNTISYAYAITREEWKKIIENWVDFSNISSVISIEEFGWGIQNEKYENIDLYMTHNTFYGQSVAVGAYTILSKFVE